MLSFRISSKFHRTVGPVNVELLPDPNNFHQTVGGEWLILTLCTQKLTKKKTDCTSEVVWLLADQPAFYRTCLVGPKLLGLSMAATLFSSPQKNLELTSGGHFEFW